MKISTLYNLGQILYLKTDPEQKPGMVIAIIVNPGAVSYSLSFGGEVSEHYEIEVSEELDVVLKTSN